MKKKLTPGLETAIEVRFKQGLIYLQKSRESFKNSLEDIESIELMNRYTARKPTLQKTLDVLDTLLARLEQETDKFPSSNKGKISKN